MDIKEKIGHRIKQLREEYSITQEALSQYAELDQSYLSGVENGKRNISIENIEKIANAFDISTKEFFNSPLFK